MSLPAGARLGNYEILGPLGAGGMGEVYRARDVRIDREVAIKVLPPSFAGEPGRLRRFELEARSVGRLSHPNILTLFDLGSHEGAPYLVCELLEGRTLRERLAGGALPPAEARDLALQNARGLAAAHERGIVHRDLKPENLFVARHGLIKILDFGLAKIEAPAPAAPAGDLNAAPTAFLPTEVGTILGTAAYMSPEQVRGGRVDPRSDVFSFGVILHEMLTGQRPFERETAAETMTAILRQEPPALPASVPEDLRRLVRRSMAKAAGERPASGQDLVAALEAAVPPPRPAARPAARPAWIAAGALVAVAALAAALLHFMRQGPGDAAPPVLRLSHITLT